MMDGLVTLVLKNMRFGTFWVRAPDRHMAAGFPVAQMPHSDVTAQPPIQQPVWA